MRMQNSTIIIDVREPSEYNRSHVEGAINISPIEFMNGQFMGKLNGVAEDARIIVYCITGQRSNTCSMFLRDAGFTNITNGINEHQVRSRFLSD